MTLPTQPPPFLYAATDEELAAEVERRKAARLEKYRPALALIHDCKNDFADYYGPGLKIDNDDSRMIEILDNLKELLP